MNETEQKNNRSVYASSAALAWLGDAVYETEVREHLLDLDVVHSDALHKKAVPFVCAKGQATAIKALFETLSEEEKTVVTRARNKRVTSQPRHADPIDYRWATGFEALFGYWKINGEEKKIASFAKEAMRVITEENEARKETGRSEKTRLLVSSNE